MLFHSVLWIAVLMVMLILPSQSEAASFLRTDNGQPLSAQELEKSLSESGVLITLDPGETFEQLGLSIETTDGATIYVTKSTRYFSIAILDGIIKEKNSREKATIGDVLVHDQTIDNIDVYDFDVARFLESLNTPLPEKIKNNLKKKVKVQQREQFFGFLRPTNINLQQKDNSPEKQLNNIEPASGSGFDITADLIGILTDINSNAVRDVNTDIQELATQTIDTFVFLPLHILIQWGAGARDLDIHLTGPDGMGDRFHLFYRNLGNLDDTPHAKIIDDCISTNCSEVVKIAEANDGGIYRAYVHNFGNQDQASEDLSTNSDLELQVIRGGVYTPSDGDTDDGSTIEGGEVLLSISPDAGQVGNTWQAVEIEADTSTVTPINTITNIEVDHPENIATLDIENQP